jgi:c-di-GMP-binding flagellar brake protein YcgR
MTRPERRKYPRVPIYDPISYLCIDGTGKILAQDMGVARDISQGGIQIETLRDIEEKAIRLAFVDNDKEMVEIKGEVVYCRKNDQARFRVGIRLCGQHEENVDFVKKLIKFYHVQKDRPHVVVSGSEEHRAASGPSL